LSSSLVKTISNQQNERTPENKLQLSSSVSFTKKKNYFCACQSIWLSFGGEIHLKKYFSELIV
jgi:hypothetical protein